MARRKRPYVPKVKGCYECSQRRIDCDRTHPYCSKCASKGISCSGFGFRYKFRNGFASRRKSPSAAAAPCPSGRGQCESQGSSVEPSWQHSFRLIMGHQNSITADSCGYRAIRPRHSPASSRVDLLSETVEASDDWDRDHDVADESSLDAAPVHSPVDESRHSALFPYEDLLDYFDVRMSPDLLGEQTRPPSDDDVSTHSPKSLTSYTDALPINISPLDASTRLLLMHFSTSIAPEMVVVDGRYNGWRHLILPAAMDDDLVMSSVLAASAFHLSRTRHQTASDPGTLYRQAIQKLQRRRDLSTCDRDTRQMVVLAIVVLLVAVMITGCSDFPVMFRMLQSAVDAIGGDDGLREGGDLAQFSLRQIRKMRVYAAPLLSQEAGFYAVVSQASQSFDCLRYYADLYPERASDFDILADLRRQAFAIYLDRVASHETGSPADPRSIDSFISTLEMLPPAAPGEHVLVWPCFIAAAESRLPEHRAYFERLLSRQHARNGFANISKALDLLQTIWHCKSQVSWPSMIPVPQVFIM